MVAITFVFAGCITLLCQLLLVTPDSITRDRKGNLPLPPGGIGAF